MKVSCTPAHRQFRALPLAAVGVLLLLGVTVQPALSQVNTFTLQVPRKNLPQLQISQIVMTVQVNDETPITFNVTPPAGAAQQTANLQPSAGGSSSNLLFAPDLMQVHAPDTTGLGASDPRRRNYTFVLTPTSDFNINCATAMSTATETWQVSVVGGANRIIAACSVSLDENVPANQCNGGQRMVPQTEPFAELGGITAAEQTCRFGLDAMIVLDRSGSMSGKARPADPAGPGNVKIASLRSAVNSFVTTLDAVRSAETTSFGSAPSDNVGVVLFNQNSSDLPGLAGGLQPYNPINSAAIVAGVNGTNPSGATSIGDGLHAAATALAGGGATRRRVILIMSDGMQNSDRLVGADVAGQRVFTYPPGDADGPNLPNLGNYQIYSVTVGTGAAVLPQINQDVALATGGFYLNSEDDAGDLTEFFGGLLQNFLETATWQTLLSGSDRTTATKPFAATVPVTSTTNALVFTLTPRLPNERLCIRITPPAGGAPVDQRCGSGSVVVGVTVPSNGRHLGGNWQIQVTHPPVPEFAATTPSSGAFHLLMIGDDVATGARVSTFSRTYTPNEPVRVEARLRELGVPLTGLNTSQLRVGVASPTQTLGDLLSASNAGTSRPPGDEEPNDANKKLQNEVESNPNALADTTASVTMRDDGAGGDRVAKDGVYTALVNVPKYGHTDLLVVLEGSSKGGGAFRRQKVETVYLEARPDGGASKVSSQVVGQNLLVNITPLTRSGDRLGPGWKNHLWVRSGAAQPVKPTDNLDGTYTATLPAPGGPPDFTIHFIPDSVLLTDAVTPDKLPRPLDDNTVFYPPGGVVSRWSLSVHGGVNVPLGDFGNRCDGGLGIGLDVEYRFTSMFAAELFYGHDRFDCDVTETLNHLSANGKIYFGQVMWKPFVGAGIGRYDLSPGSSATGGNVFGGVQINVHPQVAVEATAKWHFVEIGGADSNFFTLQGGVRLRF